MAEMETPQGIRFELIERQQSFPCGMQYMIYCMQQIPYPHRNEKYKLNILYHQALTNGPNQPMTIEVHVIFFNFD